MSCLAVEYGSFIAYVLLGPTVWILLGFAMVKGRDRMLLLNRPAGRLVDPPRVTLMIPAKDEGERMRACLDAAIGQDYPNYSVLAVDDRSTDETGKIMDELAGGHANLSVMHIPHRDVPAGWTGKTHALHSAVPHADGDWLLLVDSDVIIQPDTLGAMMDLAVNKPCDLVSLLPRIESGGFWEQLVIPLAATTMSTLYLIALTNNDHLKNAFANGQILLMSRSAYDKVGGHERVRARYCEDIALAELTKAAGMRVRICWGNDFAAVRMYNSLASIVRGWSRLFFAASDGRPWRAMLGAMFLIVCSLSAYVVIAWGIYRTFHPVNRFGHIGWLLAGAVHLVFMMKGLATTYAWSGNSRRNALLFPLSAVVLLRIFFKSLLMCVTGKVEWRGTHYGWRSSRQVGS